MNKMHIFKKQDRYYIFDGSSFDAYRLPTEITEKLDVLNEEELKDIADSLKIQNKNYKSVSKRRVEENPDLCNRLILNITSKCNLACRYCYANEGAYGIENSKFLSEDTLENAMNSMIEMFKDGINYIQLFGGEPLFNKKILYNTVNRIKDIFKKRNLSCPKFLMVTNGTLLDDESIDFIVKNFESITISLDGNKYINDFNRRYTREDLSVYDSVKENMKKIKEKDKNFIVFCEATINKAHIDDYVKNKDINNFYSVMQLGFDYFQIAPVFGSNNEKVSLEYANPEDIKEYFDSIIERTYYDENGEIKQSMPSYNVYNCLKNKVAAGNGCGASQNDIAIDVNGDIYPCFMFIGSPEFLIGNVNDFNLEEALRKRKRIQDDMKSALHKDKCNECWAQDLCSLTYGHCMGEKYLVNNDLSKPVKLNCQLTKVVLERIIFEMIEYLNKKK